MGGVSSLTQTRLIFVRCAFPTSADRVLTPAVPSMASTTGSEEGVSGRIHGSWLCCDPCCRWLSQADLRAAPTRCRSQGPGREGPLGRRKTSCASGEGATTTSRACTSCRAARSCSSVIANTLVKIDSNSTLPTTISSIRVLNANHTRKGFLERIFDPIVSANKERPYTLAEAIREVSIGADKLHRYGIKGNDESDFWAD